MQFFKFSFAILCYLFTCSLDVKANINCEDVFESKVSAENLHFEDGSLQFVEVPPDTIIDVCNGVYSYPLPVANSVCTPIEITETQIETDTPDCEYGYTLERIFTANDACGNEISVSQLVSFLDITPPSIEIVYFPAESYDSPDSPSFGYVPCTTQGLNPEIDVELDIFDNCSSGNEIDISWTMIDYPSCGATHTEKYICTITDACGNTALDSLFINYYDFNPPHIGGFLMLDPNGDVIANGEADLTSENIL